MRVFQMQRYTAIALLVFLTIHMVVTHYPPFHIDFSRIIERMGQPLWKAVDIAFLFAVLVHALTGTYAVVIDLERFYDYRRVIGGVAVVVFVLAFLYGTKTILAFQPPA